ncbi:MAG: hypothetical protein M3P93_04415 [Actinomycetota bacterium]|nr:hypothetical protein [Actinomycetota bacterium]
MTAASSPPRHWWRDRARRDRVALWVFAVLGVGGIVLAGLLQLAQGDQRTVVVTMERDAGQAGRDRVKAACGDLPGVGVVPDRGDPDPLRQGRLPVRFDISGTTVVQQAALERCLAQHDDVVRGFLTES